MATRCLLGVVCVSDFYRLGRMCQRFCAQIALHQPSTMFGPVADQAKPLPRRAPPPTDEVGSFLESLMDTELYSIGAFFCDEHPELVDEVVARSEAIEQSGLVAYSRQSGGPI